MKTLTLSAKLLKNLGSLEIGPFVVYAIDAEFGGGWKVEGIENHKEMAVCPTLEAALAFVETYLEG